MLTILKITKLKKTVQIFFFFFLILGAYNITQEAKEKSEMAKNLVTGAEKMLKISKSVRNELDELISNRKDSFDKGLEENEKNLNGLDKKVAKLDDKLMDINEMVRIPWIYTLFFFLFPLSCFCF